MQQNTRQPRRPSKEAGANRIAFARRVNVPLPISATFAAVEGLRMGSSLRTVGRRSSRTPAARSLCVLGELLQAVRVQAERDLPAQPTSASLSECEPADQHLRAVDRVPTVVAHILFAPNQSHRGLPPFSVIWSTSDFCHVTLPHVKHGLVRRAHANVSVETFGLPSDQSPRPPRANDGGPSTGAAVVQVQTVALRPLASLSFFRGFFRGTNRSGNQRHCMSPMMLPSASFTEAISLPPPTSLTSWSASAQAPRSAFRLFSMSSTCQ